MKMSPVNSGLGIDRHISVTGDQGNRQSILNKQAAEKLKPRQHSKLRTT